MREPRGESPRQKNKCYRAEAFFLAIQPYQAPDAIKTRLQPAVNQIRNGTGRQNHAPTAPAADKPPQRKE